MIKDKLYKHRLKEYEKKVAEHESSGKWNASNLGSCKRKQFYKRKGEEITDKPTLEALGKMEMGRKHEDNLIEEMKEAGIKVDWEQEEVEYKDVVGKIDCFLPETDEIVEIKSQQSRSFWWAKKQGSMLKRAHAFQIALYMIAKKKEKGIVIYISKDDNTMHEQEVELTKEIQGEVEQRIEEMNKYWAEDKLPEGIPDEEWECKYCPYFKKCKGVNNENS